MKKYKATGKGMGGAGAPTTARTRMPGFAKKTVKKFTGGNVKLTRTPQAGKAMPSKRKINASY